MTSASVCLKQTDFIMRFNATVVVLNFIKSISLGVSLNPSHKPTAHRHLLLALSRSLPVATLQSQRSSKTWHFWGSGSITVIWPDTKNHVTTIKTEWKWAQCISTDYLCCYSSMYRGSAFLPAASNSDYVTSSPGAL